MVTTRSTKVGYVLLGLFLGLLPLVFLVFGSAKDNSFRLEAHSISDSAGVYQKNVTNYQLPSEAYLFSKKIPLEKWEIKERYEREFYYNLVNSDQVVLWYKRLKRWEKIIDSSLDANNLDRDLKYLMVAESGVRNVESPAKASGFWQFIPPTGERWGLRVDELIDERLDPIRSTAAAMRCFTALKAQFNGDYFLMAAGYNMGEDNVRQVMEYQHQSSYWNLYINEETMRYIFRIAVIKELLERGSRYGFRFESVAPYEAWNVRHLSVQGPIESIADWAVAQGFSYKDIKVYNQWLKGRSIPKGNFDITVPSSDASRTTVYPQ